MILKGEKIYAELEMDHYYSVVDSEDIGLAQILAQLTPVSAHEVVNKFESLSQFHTRWMKEFL